MSSTKEVFFINPGKKIIRGVGIGVCIVLAVLFIVMIVTSAAFGSAKAVGIFGFDVFVCESGDYDSVPAGSAVIATKCAPYDLEQGNLVLYSTDPMDNNAELAMGYYYDFKLIDGVYYLSLVNGSDSTVISEAALIGKAEWCSPFLGTFITFMKSPWGVFVMAVLPCALLLIYDLLRTKASERPLPEIIPQVKNTDENTAEPQISVSENGSASFRKNTHHAASADSVLFTYGSAAKKQPAPGAPTMSDRDVLSLLNAPSHKQEKESKDAVKPFLKTSPADIEKSLTSENEKPEKPTLPAPVAAKRYIDNTVTPVNLTKEPEKSEKRVSTGTAELQIPEKPRKKRPDAFFAQSEAPQIGKGISAGKTGKQSSKAIIDLEDALAAAPSRSTRPESSRRSADILAAKNRSDLIPEDDDTRDKSRYDVDDILAGIERRHHDQ